MLERHTQVLHCRVDCQRARAVTARTPLLPRAKAFSYQWHPGQCCTSFTCAVEANDAMPSLSVLPGAFSIHRIPAPAHGSGGLPPVHLIPSKGECDLRDAQRVG
jgi:hypothetical protein